MRPAWNEIWKRFVLDIAERSADPKYKVGSVIVSEDNTQVLSMGYNGDHKGGPNVRDSLETGNSGFIHAEINALIKMDYNNPKKKKMYLTHSPCLTCCRAVVNAGINEIYYIDEYIDTTGLDILKQSGISVYKI
tara:strand:+ start:1213 stop:1614 length:402 start_codon:yes stop_codon:yes gene_type:complete